MAGGLLGTGQGYRSSAMGGLRDFTNTNTQMEASRDAANKQMEAAKQSQNMGMGAAAGGLIGFAVGGPIGAGIGVLVGGLGGSLF